MKISSTHNGHPAELSNDAQPIEAMENMDSRIFTADQKIDFIARHFKAIMGILGLDTSQPHLENTPHRVAKMYVNEVFRGLDPDNHPNIKLFPNEANYRGMLMVRDIDLYSYCEHHFVPIVGKVHVAYIPNDHIIGLSKINRLVDFYARKPQLQERLTVEFSAALKEILSTPDIAVVVEATHFCVASRGIQHTQSTTTTSEFSGAFLEAETRSEFWEKLRKKD